MANQKATREKTGAATSRAAGAAKKTKAQGKAGTAKAGTGKAGKTAGEAKASAGGAKKKSTSVAGEKKRNTSAGGAKKKSSSAAKQYQEDKISDSMKAEIVLAGTLLVSVLFFLSYINLCGTVGKWLNYLIFGTMGIFGYLFPFVLFLTVAFGLANKGSRVARRKILSLLGGFLCIAALVELAGGYDTETKWYEYFALSAAEKSGGGILGGILVRLLCPLFETVATAVILVALLLICLMLLTGKELFAYIKRLSNEAVEGRRMAAEERLARRQAADREEAGQEDGETPEERQKARIITFSKGSGASQPETMAGKRAEEKPGETIRFIDALKSRGRKKASAQDSADLDGNIAHKESEMEAEKIAPDRLEEEQKLREAMDRIPISGQYQKDSVLHYEEELRRKFGNREGGGLEEYGEPDTETAVGKQVRLIMDADKRNREAYRRGIVGEEGADSWGGAEKGMDSRKPAMAMEGTDSWKPAMTMEGTDSRKPAMAMEGTDSRRFAAAAEETDSWRFAGVEEDTGYRGFEASNSMPASQGAEDSILESAEAGGELDRVNLTENVSFYPAEVLAENTRSLPERGWKEGKQAKEEEQARKERWTKEEGQAKEEGWMKKEGQAKEERQMKEEGQAKEEGRTKEEEQAEELVKAGQDAPTGLEPANQGNVVSFADHAVRAAGKNGQRAALQESRPKGNEDSSAAQEEIARQLEQAVPEKKYEFPSLELLAEPQPGKGANERELKETAMKLQRTLESFGVHVTVTNISCGPTVTQYELQPEQGVKVSQITKLSDDIKLNMAAADIRIEAPIPGKAAVGIEIPNKENTAVLIRELLESKEFREHKSKLAFAVGKNISGQTIVADIAKMPHLLIAGATGSGKSVCINTIIMSILYKADPKDVRLIMVDPKVVELSVYNGIPHLLIPVVTDPKKASAALNWAVAEMTDRYNKFAELGVRDLSGYNERIASVEEEDPKYQKLPQIVIIVDELADLMMVASGEVEEAICRLAQLARAAGLHLVIATQRPTVNVITGLIKANVPSRIAFAVASAVDSRTILDGVGAEKLLGKGDMLFFPSGYPKPVRIQGAFVSDDEVSKVVDFLKEQVAGSGYNEEVSKRITSTAAEGASSGERDDYFVEAGKFIIEKEKASIGMLQRVYKIGFNRAARIMDQLTAAGVVGPEEGTKPRKILMTMEEFEDYIENVL